MIKGDLLQINGVKVPAIVSYKIQRTKLWRDAERNMNGDVRASFVGLYPKLALSIGYTDFDENATLCELLDTPYFNVTYFDNRSKTTHTAQYYAGDYDAELYSKNRGKYKPFTVNLLPVSKRGY